jgi:hypothetical protein
MPANPSRVDRSHEYIRDVAYRERGRALADFRAVALMLTDMIDLTTGQFQEKYGEVTFGNAWDVMVNRARDAQARWESVNDTDAE